MDDSAISSGETKDAEAKSQDKETNFNEKKQLAKHKTSIYYLHFY